MRGRKVKLRRKSITEKYTENCVHHTKKRCEERYGLELNKADIRKICAMIQTNNYTRHPIFKATCTRKVCVVKYKGRDLTVVYSKKIKQVVTVLPRDGEEEPCQK